MGKMQVEGDKSEVGKHGCGGGQVKFETSARQTQRCVIGVGNWVVCMWSSRERSELVM